MFKIFNLFRPTKSLIGVDFGDACVHLVELQTIAKQPSLKAVNFSSFEAGLICNGKVNDVPKLAQVLRHAVLAMNTKTTELAFSIPSSAVITRVVDMPAGLSHDEIEVQLLMEVEQYIPYSVEEITLDFSVLEQQPGALQTKVLLVATKKEIIDSLVEISDLAGLKAKVVDVDSYCFERLSPYLQIHPGRQKEQVAVVDIRSNSIEFTALQNGRVIYSREDEFGTNLIRKEVLERFGLTIDTLFDGAHEQPPSSEFEFEVMQPSREFILQQVLRARQYYYSSSSSSSSSSQSLELTLLSGNVFSDTKTVEFLSENLNSPVELANPFLHIPFSEKINAGDIGANQSSFLVATGLALRGLQ